MTIATKHCTLIYLATLAVGLFISQGADLSPPGGFHPIPSNNPYLQPAVNFAAANVNQKCNCYFCQTLMGVNNASEKVVSGVIYVFSMQLQESEKCTYSDCLVNVSSTTCPPSPKAKPYWCDVTILARPWSNHPYAVQNLTCSQSDY